VTEATFAPELLRSGLRVLDGNVSRRTSETNPHSTILIQKIPRFISHTKADPTGQNIERFPDNADATGPVRPFAPAS
jgi:hypothetical protein